MLISQVKISMKIRLANSLTLSRIAILIIAVLFFIAGGLIYVLYRSPTLHMFCWFRNLRLYQFVLQLRSMQLPTISEWVKYSLPDGLWMTSYLLIMITIWYRDQTKLSLTLSLLLPIFINLSEILQLFHVFKGTFDPVDLICYDIPTITYIIYYYYEKKNSNSSVCPDDRTISVVSRRL